MGHAPDHQIWAFARANGLAILTQDSDFERMALLSGAPPKVVLVRAGNLSPRLMRALIASQADTIREFLDSPQGDILTIGLR